MVRSYNSICFGERRKKEIRRKKDFSDLLCVIRLIFVDELLFPCQTRGEKKVDQLVLWFLGFCNRIKQFGTNPSPPPPQPKLACRKEKRLFTCGKRPCTRKEWTLIVVYLSYNRSWEQIKGIKKEDQGWKSRSWKAWCLY